MKPLEKKEIKENIPTETIRQVKTTDPKSDRTKKIDAIIRKDFERYKAVFKALS